MFRVPETYDVIVVGSGHAGIEAALESSGILDAWVTPDGEVLSTDTDDVLLRPGLPLTSNLSTVLHPAVDRENPRAAAVSDTTVAGLLATIGSTSPVPRECPPSS